jgi:DNA N-6-adenine-methyltransferase (Dam)
MRAPLSVEVINAVVERAEARASSLRLVPIDATPPTREVWASRITSSYRKSVLAIVETGQLLVAAKKALPHGEFGDMCELDLPFDIRTAQKLMAIASDPRITTQESYLPAAWTTLFELSKLDDETFQRGIDDGSINPSTSRKDVHRLKSYSGDIEWFTPREYIERSREVMGAIDCDPASCDNAQKTVQASTYFTTESDGLSQEWCGRIWLNPPYSAKLVSAFGDKLLAELDTGNATEAILLTNAAVDTAWHHRLQTRCSLMCCTAGRIKFESGTGRESNGNAVGQTFLYFGPNPSRFASVFRDVGSIWAPYVTPPGLEGTP